MRLPDECRFGRIAKAGLLLGACALAAGCASSSSVSGANSAVQLAMPANGPQADYPVLVGDPYEIDGVTYKPLDTLNYDEVGNLAAGGGAGVTAAHHTLPVPSYAEVTSLDTGRTILVRIERHGPMDGHSLIALSPDALAQLDGAAGAAVRVRRVNPPEAERARLRSGEAAPLRMDTPMSLVQVLRRGLPGQPEAAGPLATAARPTAQVLAPIEEFDPGASDAVEEMAEAEPEAVPQPVGVIDLAATPPGAEHEAVALSSQPPEAAAGGFVVQAAAFSSQERADRAASALDHSFVLQAGEYWRLRTGPFPTRSEAEASLAKARTAGYTDARILTSG